MSWCRVALVCSCLISATPILASESTVEVQADSVRLYVEADVASKVFATVSKGTILTIQESTRDWYRVSAPGSGYGVWVRKLDLEAAPTASKPAAVPSTPPAMPQPQPNQPGSPGTVAGGLSIEHQGVGCVVAGKFPEFDAKLDPADQVSRAQIDFHAEDDPRWYFVAMKLENGVYRGILPQPLKETKRIHYYIEATGSDLTTSRTQEYTPEVVESAGVCVSRKTVAVVVASASVVVQAVVPGAPAIPAGFSAAGLATTTSEIASTASVAGGSGAASHSGLIIGLVGGVGAAAAGIIVASSNDSSAPITGTWSGTETYHAPVTALNPCTSETDAITLDFVESQGRLSGQATKVILQLPGPATCAAEVGAKFTPPISGNFNAPNINWTEVAPAGTNFCIYAGIKSGSSMNGTWTCTLTAGSGTWSLTRQ